MPTANCCAWSPRKSLCPTARRTSGTGCCSRIPLLVAREAEFGGKVRAVGAGFGGVLESRTGRIRISVQVPGWQDFPLQDWLERTFHLPALVANDTVAGGYAELCRGAGIDARHFFYSNIGSGIGGALFLDRVPYDGLGMGGAYLGHTYVPDWTADVAGREIKLENLCSGWSIETRLRTPGYVARESQLMAMCHGDVSSLTCAMLGEAARSGDTFATAEIDRIARSYAIALSNLITLVSPDVVAIGGGVANLGDVLLDPIRRFTEERVFVSVRGAYRIVPCVVHGRGGAGRRRTAGQGPLSQFVSRSHVGPLRRSAPCPESHFPRPTTALRHPTRPRGIVLGNRTRHARLTASSMPARTRH